MKHYASVIIGHITRDINIDHEDNTVEICGGAVFWSFLLGKHSKANWWKKTAMPGIGEHLTIRTAGTCRKLAGL